MIGVIVETNVLQVTQALELKSQATVPSYQRHSGRPGQSHLAGLSATRRQPGGIDHYLHKRSKYEHGDTVTMQMGTEDQIYKFVDKGTQQHYIFPRSPGGRLAFQWAGPGSYRAATRPGVLGSRQHGPTGPTVFRRYVLHPGTEARRFSDTIQEKYDRMANQIAEKHIREWQTT